MESHHIELNEKSRKVDQKICVQLTKKQKKSTLHFSDGVKFLYT